MSSPRRLYVHIGLKKTGTSYLQSIFWASQDELARQGLDLVPPSKPSTFHLMLDVRQRYDAQHDPAPVAEALQRFPEQLAAATGSRALLSEESLAAASAPQIRRLIDHCSGREVHVVVTVRDLARQIPSAWQQQLRAGGSPGFSEFVEGVVSRTGTAATRFWNSQDLVAVLDRWREAVPAERIHVVTVPPPGAPRELLLERYASVLGVDPTTLHAEARGNPSLGRVQAELLRRVNAELTPDQRRRQTYGPVGKRYFSIGVLGEQQGEPARTPAGVAPWCQEQADTFIRHLESGGYDVVGDLSDLQPPPSAFTEDGQEVTEAELADSAVSALATMLGMETKRLQTRRARRRRRKRAQPNQTHRLGRLRGLVTRLGRRSR